MLTILLVKCSCVRLYLKNTFLLVLVTGRVYKFMRDQQLSIPRAIPSPNYSAKADDRIFYPRNKRQVLGSVSFTVVCLKLGNFLQSSTVVFDCTVVLDCIQFTSVRFLRKKDETQIIGKLRYDAVR